MLASVVQLSSTPDPRRNRARAEELVRAAASAGAELVVLPEHWTALGTPQDVAAAAEPLDGPTSRWATGIARELGIDLVAGSFPELGADGRGHNTCLHAGPDGALQALYRKIHMFDVEVGGQTYRESALQVPGREVVVSRTATGRGLGLAVCYDLRFPELFRIQALRGAQILALASAFTLTTTREHWEVLLRARAIEDQCFVLAANQVGRHAPGYESGGRSMIVDPWGVVLAQAPDAETHVLAELDFDRLERVRASLPSLANRRPGAYEWPG